MRHIFAAINIYVEINYFILKWPQYILWSTGNGTGICRKHKYKHKHRQRRRRRHTGYCTHNAVWSVRVCVCNVAYSCWFLRPHSQCNRALIDTVNDMHIMCASVCACVCVQETEMASRAARTLKLHPLCSCLLCLPASASCRCMFNDQSNVFCLLKCFVSTAAASYAIDWSTHTHRYTYIYILI